MSNNDVQATDNMKQQRNCSAYVSHGMVIYQDGGSDDSGRRSGRSSNNGNGSGGDGDWSSNGNGGSDFDDDCESWSEDGFCPAGANGSSSSGSTDEGCYSGDGEKSSTTHRGGSSSSSDGSGSDGGSGENKRKWLTSLRTVIDRVVGSERKGRSKKKVVKTILRPPTTYKYVIGMSGFPSKVPVYPKTTMM